MREQGVMCRLGVRKMRTTAKALSVHPNWVRLMMAGRKTIETRPWRTRHRGPLIICATKVPHDPELSGFAILEVELTDIRPMERGDEIAACCSVFPRAQAWILRNIRPIERFPVVGKQGVFEIELPQGGLRYL